MGGLARDGAAEASSLDHILGGANATGKVDTLTKSDFGTTTHFRLVGFELGVCFNPCIVFS